MAQVTASCAAVAETRLRSVRVPDDVWKDAQERAAKRGETVSAVIVRALERYAARR